MSDTIPEASYEVVPHGTRRSVCFTRSMNQKQELPQASLVHNYNTFGIKCNNEPNNIYFIVTFYKISREYSYLFLIYMLLLKIGKLGIYIMFLFCICSQIIQFIHFLLH